MTSGGETCRRAGLAGQQIDGVRQDVQHGAQRLRCASRTARQIEDERASADAAQAAAQHGEWRLGRAFGAHSLGNAVDQLGADGAGGFRRYVARGNASAARSDDQLRLPAQADERRLDGCLLIRNDFLVRDFKSVLAQQPDGRRAGDIGALAACGRITDGQYGSSSRAHGRTISRRNTDYGALTCDIWPELSALAGSMLTVQP